MECPLCPAAVTTTLGGFKELRSHLHRAHSPAVVHVYACPACPEAFKVKRGLSRHLLHKHEDILDEFTKKYYGFICSDCGLYLRIQPDSNQIEWEAFVELMEKHSPTHLVPTVVHAREKLSINPKISLEFARIERSKRLDSIECPHCRKSFVGRERIKIHLLQGRCIVRQPVSGLALLVNKTPSHDVFHELADQDRFGLKGNEMDEHLLRQRMIRLAIAVKIPVLRKASKTKIPFTPKGTPHNLSNCGRCKMLISGWKCLSTHICHDGAHGLAIDAIYNHHDTAAGTKSRIPCFVCPDYTACSVLGLQVHLTLHHDLDYLIDKGMETAPEVGAQSRHSSAQSSRHCSPIKSPVAKRPSVDIPDERAPLKLKIPRTSATSRDPSLYREPRAGIHGSYNKETGKVKLMTKALSTDVPQAAPAPSSSTTRPTDPQGPSTSSSSRQDDANLDRSYDDDDEGGLVIAEDEEPMDVEAGDVGDEKKDEEMKEKKDEDSPFDIDDMMEETEKVEDDKKKKEEADGRNGVDAKTNGHDASNGHAQNGLSHEDESLQHYHLSLYISPPKSKYTPDDGFFMLCRLCMTVLPAGGNHFKHHVCLHHREEHQDYISCSECSLLVLRSEIRQHDEEHAWTKYICSITKKAFATDMHYYLYRKEEHNVDLVHFCKRCNIATKRAELMKEHILKGDCRRGLANPKDEQYMMFPRPVPGMIAETFFNFDPAMQSEGPFIIRIDGQNRMTECQHCANNDCMRAGLLRREMVAVSDFDAARFNDEERQMIRHARLSCPVDGFPLPYHRYRYHDFGPYEKPALILEEEEKKLKKQIKDVKGRNRQQFGKIDEYFGNDPWRLNCLPTVDDPEEADDAATDAAAAANSPAASATAAAVGSPAAVAAAAARSEADEPMPTADKDDAAAGPSTSDASSRNEHSQEDTEMLKGRMEAEFKIYQEMGYKVDLYVKNFCKRGERFPYTAEQIKETRIDVNTFMTKQEMTKCLFCHSSQGLYPVQKEKRDRWIGSFVESMEAAVLKYTNAASISFTNVYNGKLNKKPNLRVCARHFNPDEIDEEGMLQNQAVPKYLWRKCLLCKAAIHNKEGAGLEMPIYYKEQLRALLAVRSGEMNEKELARQCELAVQYACPVCVVHAADASPDTLSEQARERIAALRAKMHARANGMASSAAGSSTASVEAESSENLMGVFNSAMRHAALEPPTPFVPARQPSESPPLQQLQQLQQPAQSDFLEPPTPYGVLNSALRYAALEPPTPAPPVRQPSVSPPLGLIRSAARDRELEPPTPAQQQPVFAEPPTPRTYKPLLDAPVSLDVPPATPGHQEHVGQIRKGLLADAPSQQQQRPPAAPAAPAAAAAAAPPVMRNRPQPPQPTIRYTPIMQQVPPQFPQLQPPQQQQQQQQQLLMMMLPNGQAVALPESVARGLQNLIKMRHESGGVLRVQDAEKEVRVWTQNLIQRPGGIPSEQEWMQLINAQEIALGNIIAARHAQQRAQQQQQQQQQQLLQQAAQQQFFQQQLLQQAQARQPQAQQLRMQQPQVQQHQVQQPLVQQPQMQQPQMQQHQTFNVEKHLEQMRRVQEQQPLPQHHHHQQQRPPLQPQLLQQPPQLQQQLRQQHPQQSSAGPSGLLMPTQQHQQQQQQRQQQQQQQQQQQPPAGPAGSHLPAPQHVQHLQQQQQQPGPSHATPQSRPPPAPQGLPSVPDMKKFCLNVYRQLRFTEAMYCERAEMLEGMEYNKLVEEFVEATRKQQAMLAAGGAAAAAAAAPAAPSTSAAAAAAEDPMAKWTACVPGVPFECVLCNPSTKPGRTKRIMPTSDNVEPHLDQLGLTKGSFRRQFMAGVWADGGHLEMGICHAHLTEPGNRAYESGKMCNTCAQRYIPTEESLHSNHSNKEARFCCLDCCTVLPKFTEQRFVEHMIKNHKMILSELRIDCPFKNDPKTPCNHTSSSIDEYRRHLNDPTQPHFRILFYQTYDHNRSHKCCLRFTDQNSLMVHNDLVLGEKTRLDIKEDISGRECCPLCGSINLWEEEFDGQKISHFTLHQLEWKIMCRYDLKTLRRGETAKWHHVSKHSQGSFCMACNEQTNQQQMVHADSHLVIGLKTRQNTEAIACDNSRALLGLPKIGGDPMETDD